MEPSCFPAGFSYLSAFGFAIAIVVLSSWLVMLMRAVYREDSGFRRGLADATPLWVPGLAGIVALFPIGNSLVDWADSCLPATGSTMPGALIIGIGLALALTAVGRLIFGRVRMGSAGAPMANREATSLQESPADAAITEERSPNLPPERRRIIVEYVVIYGVAVLITLTGVRLLQA